MSSHPTPAEGGADQLASAGQVAIVGCGPAGCYTAQAILRLAPDARITVFDARPTPFGLVRYGVAADHQGMKNVTKQFERIFASDRVEFVGNTRIGEEIGLAELEQNFDAVVLATGLPEDRPLAVPVTGAARVIGAGQLLRFLNGDPDSLIRTGGPTRLGGEVVVIGAGNVAMDVARLLCKTDDGFDGSDIDDDARDALATSDLRHLTVLSRGPLDRVRWDAAMYSELCALPNVSVYLDGALDEKSVHHAGRAAGTPTVRVDIRCSAAPVAIEVDDGRTVVCTRSADGESRYPADTVVTAMGFVGASIADAVTGHRIVRVGGCASGALGNLAENRTLAKAAAREIVTHLESSSGRAGLAGLGESVSLATTFADWTVLDRAETMRARPNRVRTKFTSWPAAAQAVVEYRRRTATAPHPLSQNP